MLVRAGFALVTAALLLAEIALTRLFSATIGYYFAFMSISVAMLGLGAGGLWVTLRGPVALDAPARAGRAAWGVAVAGALATLIYLRFYPEMGAPGTAGQVAYVALFGVLFAPFLLGGILISVLFEAHHDEFGAFYAIDLLGAAAGCVVAVFLLDAVPAPAALLLIYLVAGPRLAAVLPRRRAPQGRGRRRPLAGGPAGRGRAGAPRVRAVPRPGDPQHEAGAAGRR
jgi:hypothetical protein